ncbi:MAG: RecX family transcriptional regulator [Bryobacteraceae bacterium]|nr:RecX family transcriptional regulator [Bryobacteraceae bacterium]
MAFKSTPKLDAAHLKDYAARLLASRPLTSSELRRKLRAKAAHPADIDPLMEALRGYGVIDDTRLASNFAQTRADSGSMGSRKALAQLRAKGVAPATAQSAVDDAYQGRDETQMVSDYLARKFRSKNLAELLADPAKLASVYRRLRTAGFSSSASIRALKQFAAQAAALEDMPEETPEA